MVDLECLHCELNNIAKKGFHPLKSLKGRFAGDIWVIDIMILPGFKNKNVNNVLLHVLDVQTCFNILRAVNSKNAKLIITTLHSIMMEHGCPRKFVHDCGNEL